MNQETRSGVCSKNPKHPDREGTKFEEIPFVVEHWKLHPRPPLPKSLVWTEAEATLIVQSFWRGYKVTVSCSVLLCYNDAHSSSSGEA